MDKQDLYLVPVPSATDSYAPVSHKNVIYAIYEQLDRHNLSVKRETFNTARWGQQLIGYMDIQYDSNDELGLRLAFRNSYDKSMSVAFVAGAQTWICGNGIISGELQFLRKHTGNVVQEMNSKITDSINELERHFQRILEHASKMKERELTLYEVAELTGRLFITEDIITPTQLNEVKRQLLNPSYKDFEEENLWSFYNHVTHSLKKSHPTTYIQQHKNFHEYITNEFELV